MQCAGEVIGSSIQSNGTFSPHCAVICVSMVNEICFCPPISSTFGATETSVPTMQTSLVTAVKERKDKRRYTKKRTDHPLNTIPKTNVDGK